MKIGLIVDRQAVARWQSDALRRVADTHEYIVYNCTSGQPARRRARHAFYYLLNLLAVRNRMTRRTALPAGLKIVAERDFSAPTIGAWQELPAALLDNIRGDAPALFLRCGQITIIQ